jgi:hypothetical protein
LGYLWKVSPEINTVIDKTLNQLITFK